jgi:hypothetical protein
VAETFITLSTAVLKTYTVVLHELKLAHPKLEDLPYGPPEIALDELRRKILTDIASTDPDYRFLQALVNYWP